MNAPTTIAAASAMESGGFALEMNSTVKPTPAAATTVNGTRSARRRRIVRPQSAVWIVPEQALTLPGRQRRQ
jgi:hypothetical protein